MLKKILLSQKGQALVKCEESDIMNDLRISYEWWKDINKMHSNTYMEEIDGVTNIYCISFNGNLQEDWLLTQFRQRVCSM